MTYYCSVADVAERMSLTSQERISATTKITGAIRRATIEIDQEFFEYGRAEPSRATQETTLSAGVSAGATTISLTDASSFSTSGKGNVDGDSFSWSGKSSNDLTGVTGLSFSHDSGVAVQEGELAHIMREICADLAAGYIYEDQAVFGDNNVHSNTFRMRALMLLEKVAHLGGMS
jgi:hypothetical protein